MIDGATCPKCSGATIAPTRPEEEGDYCETCGIAWDRARVLADQQTSPYRASHVTTVATPNGVLHALDTAGAHGSTVCGRVLSTWIPMRRNATADAYVTCERCATRLADGITVSAATVRRARLSSQLSEPTPGT